MQSIQQALKDACEGSSRVSFRNDYSGRGMYGKQCVGITGSKEWCDQVVSTVLKGIMASVSSAAISYGESGGNSDRMRVLADREADLESAMEILPAASRDNMGYDVILYWPSLEPIKEDVAL